MKTPETSKNIIPINNGDGNLTGTLTVSGRKLHKFLEVNTMYKDWFPRMCEYGFVENVDFIGLAQKRAKPQGGRPEQDHMLTIDMAKEISMLQRTDKGKQARKYFLDVEKEFNTPERVIARALVLSEQRNQLLNIENQLKDDYIKELKPKADYTDLVLQSRSTIIVTAIAKDYGMSAQEFNQLLHEKKIQFKKGETWFLYSNLQDKGYTHTKTFDYEDSEGKTQTRITTEWTQKGRLFLYEQLKKDGIKPMIER